jgi:hypothetical protein
MAHSSLVAVAREILFISLRGEQLKYMFQILFEVSNNKAKYEALLHGLRLAVSLGIKQLLVCQTRDYGTVYIT